jgi:hypothetical protein
MASTTSFDHGPDSSSIPSQGNKRMCTSEVSAFGSKTGRSQLGADFQPSDHSVICGRGKDSYNHTGNRCFRILASAFAERYSRADCKTVKAALVFNIVTMIRQAGGHFCKYEKGAWFEVGDRYAREKVSAFFRDMLHTQYRSSAKAKTTRRRILNRSKAQTPQDGQQVVDDTGVHSDDSSISPSCSGSSTDSLGFNYSLDVDFFDIDVDFFDIDIAVF